MRSSGPFWGRFEFPFFDLEPLAVPDFGEAPWLHGPDGLDGLGTAALVEWAGPAEAFAHSTSFH